MTIDEFKKILSDNVQLYIDNFDRFDSNPQIRVNPELMRVDIVNGSEFLSGIADSEEAVEDAAAAESAESEDAADYQVRQNPDFYPVKKLLDTLPDGKTVPSAKAIDEIAKVYFTSSLPDC